ncbi:MAG: hypothetical protein R6X02_19490 [Enhygromyxa sp.]
MDSRNDLVTAMLLLATIACGPPRLGSDPGGDETGSHDEGPEPTDSGMTTLEPTTETSDPTDPTDSTDPTDPTATTIEFIPDYDDVLYELCDPWTQDCPEGEKCVPYASSGGTWDANKCVPIMGDQEPGEPCKYGGAVEATDDCDASGACFNVKEVDGEMTGTCLAFCTGSPDAPACPEGSSCKLTGDGTLTLCFPQCDPIAQDCDSGLACFWVGYEFTCVFTTEELPPGSPCGFINDCATGLICIAGEVVPDCEDPACCTPFCDTTLGDAQCAAVPQSMCVPFFEEGRSLPGYEDVGICILR